MVSMLVLIPELPLGILLVPSASVPASYVMKYTEDQYYQSNASKQLQQVLDCPPPAE